jgi:hypothetical protein
MTQLQVGQKIPEQLNQPAPPPKSPQIAKFAAGKDLPTPPSQLVAYFVQKFGVNRKAAVLAYQEMARRLAAQNIDITTMQPAQIAQIITLVAQHPKVAGQQQTPMPNMPQQGNPQSMQPSQMPHAEGGMTLPAGRSVVGDPHPSSPNKPNPEIIHNPTGAPVSVTPIHPSKEQMKRFAAGTPIMAHPITQPVREPVNMNTPPATGVSVGQPVQPTPITQPVPVPHYGGENRYSVGQPPRAIQRFDDGTPPDQMDPIEVTGNAEAPVATPTSVTTPHSSDTEMAVNEALAKQILGHFGPDAVSAAYDKLKNSSLDMQPGMVQGATPEAAAQFQTAQYNRNKDLTTGLLTAQQKGLTDAGALSNSLAGANQQQETHDLDATKKKNDLIIQQLNTDQQKKLMDPNNPVNVVVRESLKKLGFVVPNNANALDLQSLTAMNKEANDVVNSVINAHANQTNAAASAQTAATGQQNENFIEGVAKNNPNYAVEGKGIAPSPAARAGAPDWAADVKKSQDFIEEQTSKNDQLIDQAIQATKHATYSGPLGGYVAKLPDGTTQSLQKLYDTLGVQQIASAVNAVGGSAVTRSPTMDQKFLNTGPQVTDGRNVNLENLVRLKIAAEKNKLYAQEKVKYASEHPDDWTGKGFTADFQSKHPTVKAFYEPKSGKVALATDPESAKAAIKAGYVPADNGLGLVK